MLGMPYESLSILLDALAIINITASYYSRFHVGSIKQVVS